MPADLPLTVLIATQCHELGLSRHALVKRLGYRNTNKGLRRFQELLDGNLDQAADILPRLSDAFCVAPATVNNAIQATRDELARRDHQAQEAVDQEWRRTFKPHAVVLTERTTPAQITICGFMGGNRNLHIALDTTKPRSSFRQQAFRELNRRLATTNGVVPFFGRVLGVAVNLTPDLALEYGADGRFVRIVRGAVRRGRVEVTMGGRRAAGSVTFGG